MNTHKEKEGLIKSVNSELPSDLKSRGFIACYWQISVNQVPNKDTQHTSAGEPVYEDVRISGPRVRNTGLHLMSCELLFQKQGTQWTNNDKI